MYILRPDEKTTPVMLYTKEAVVRGEVVTKQNNLRINIWPRTDGVPKYMHMLRSQMLIFGGGQAKPLSYTEIFFPTAELVAFHTLPPTDEPLDFELNEENRTMEEVEVLAGTFIMKGKMRISSQTEIGVSLEVARVSWLSLYEAVISNPYLAQMQPLQIPMVLINPTRVAFARSEP